MNKNNQYAEKKVLAVDDDPFIRKMFHSMLESKGFQVFTAINGAEAVSKALQILPDVIFLDVMMPEVDGIKTLEILRKMDQTKTIPIIIVTARADTATLLKVIKNGANDFVAKPFTRSMIMRKAHFALMPSKHSKNSKESESEAINEQRPTFIDNNTFQEMKQNYVFKFDAIFVSMVRLLSNRNKTELIYQLEEIEETCANFEIHTPLPLVKEMQDLLKQNDWDEVMNLMEKLYLLFRGIQENEEQKARDKKDEQDANDGK